MAPLDASEIGLRPMLDSDVATVRALNVLVQPSPWSEGFLRDQLERLETNTNLVVETDTGTVVGHGSLAVVADEGHITSVAVVPTCQRQGVGARLVAALCRDARARGLTAMTLEVRTSNEAAILLYRRFGFAPAGIRPAYYCDPNGTTTDALVMWLHDVDDPVFLGLIGAEF